MTVLKRNDGVSFILQPYRESLTIRNTALLRKEIRYLAESHGNYARLFKSKGGEYESVFSQEQGYLLGESVWHYFQRPSNLIYCEVFSETKKQALLVVVREGKVYLDTTLSFDNLNEELTALFLAKNYRYQIYTHGKIPFEFTQTKSLNRLEEPLFDNLPIHPAFQLLPLDEALSEQGLGGYQKKSSLMIITAICLLLLGAFWWYAHTRERPIITVNPYEQYELILQSPSPEQEISGFIRGLERMDTIPGWFVSTVTYQGNSGSAQLHSLGGTATQLITSAQAMNMSVSFSAQGAAINFSSALTNRPIPDKIASVEKTVAIVIDRMMKVLPGKSVQINQSTTNQVFKQTSITISFTNISPDVLQLIGSNLDDLPVKLDAVSVTVSNGLLSGSVKISVVGN